MILRDPKILFVHIPKAAGQSISKYLQENISKPYDLNNPEFGFRHNKDLKNPGPHNTHHLFYKEYMEYNWIWDNINSYFSFAVVRNPYDRFVSAFHWRFEVFQNHTYKSFIENFSEDFRSDINRHFARQSDFITFNGKVMVDKLFYLEYDLPSNFTHFMGEKFGFSKPVDQVNKAHVKEKTPLDRATIDWINDYYDQDFKILGYEKA